MSALRKIQEDFRDTVFGADDAIAPHVQTPRGPLSRRIAVYRNTVQASLTDVLAAAYPVVRRIVGERFFVALARRYIAQHPPRLPQLSEYGAWMADAIAAAEPLRELPYLPDVARMEWARGESHFAVDAAALDPAALAAIAPDALPGLRLQLHPATRVVTSDFPIHRIWQVNQPDVIDVPAVDMSIAEAVVITRPAMTVATRKISSGDAAMIEAFDDGATLADAIDAATRAEPAFDLQSALASHLEGGTFAALTPLRS